MKRPRDIGEFKWWNFFMATAIFLIFGLLFYYRFDFRVDPKMTDEITQEKKEISNLEERIESLEKANANLQDELRKKQNQIPDRYKSNKPEKKPSVSQRP